MPNYKWILAAFMAGFIAYLLYKNWKLKQRDNIDAILDKALKQ
jgi:hypothetical protein